MFQRLFSLPLEHLESFFIFGPRGTGKTAWLKEHLKSHDHIYVDLLESALFRLLFANPEKITTLIPADFTGWIVIDEVQKVPQLLNEVHRLIESKHYRFILTGSSARQLKQKGVNLLAGRAIRYAMHPLTQQELGDAFQLTHALQWGMLPATYRYADPAGYLSTYVETYLREEVIQEGLTRNVAAFARFLEIASFSQGCTINASAIAREVGVDRQVIQHYFAILYDLLLAHWLPPFTKRAKRRLITSDKFYYFDVGVYQTLRPKGILDAPSEIAGMGLETLFYQSLLALIAYQKQRIDVYYWRTENGVEVDFIVYGENCLLAIEIKHTRVIHHRMLTGLKRFKEDYPMAKCYLFYLGDQTQYLDENITVMPFTEGLMALPQLIQCKN